MACLTRDDRLSQRAVGRKHRAFGIAMRLVPAIAAAQAVADPVPYTFIKIADSAGPLASFTGYPDVNDAGVVVFRATLDAGGQIIATGTGGALTTVIQSGGGPISFSALGGAPVINSSGAVGFWAETSPGVRGIYRIDNPGGVGPIVIVADDPSTEMYDFKDRISINDSGNIAFAGALDSAWGWAVADASGVLYDFFDGYTGAEAPCISNDGMTLFVASKVSGGFGFFAGDGSAEPIPVALNQAPFLSFSFPGALNDAHQVAFKATLTNGTQQIIRTAVQGGEPVTIATNDPPFTSIGSNGVGMNNAGTVAFVASYLMGGTGTGIFTGGDFDDDVVVKKNMQLFGSTLIGVGFSTGINNHGDIAFTYTLANGETGVALAMAPDAPVEGDLTDDGLVDGADLAVLLGSWGPCRGCPADLNGDGTVDGADLAILLGSWLP